MTRPRPLIDPSVSEIASLAYPVLVGMKRPAPSKLLDLWLHLPVVVEPKGGPPIKIRSTLEANLGNCRAFTHRDGIGNVAEGRGAGDWLGAIGYLTLLDQVGGSVKVRKPLRQPYGKSGVLQALADFSNLPEEDSLCLYALRNSLAHNFSLVNVPPEDARIGKKKRRKMTHLFTLTEGTTQLIHWSSRKWNPRQANGTEATTVDLRLLGDLVEEVIANMNRTYALGQLRIRTDGSNTPARWRRAHFFQHAPDPSELNKV